MMWVSGKFTAWTSGPRLFGGCGVIDFAGSGTVHLTGGVAALIALIFIGPRPASLCTSTRCAKAAYSNIFFSPETCSLSSHRPSSMDVAPMA